MSAQEISLASGMANAGYAAGTVLAVQVAQHLPQRRMLLVYGPLLVIGSVLAAAAASWMSISSFFRFDTCAASVRAA